MIENVVVKDLKVIPDDRGCLVECLRSDDPFFKKFGQFYFTSCYPGIIKAWHLHKIQTDNVVCVSGMMKLVLCDAREGSSTYQDIDEYFIGYLNPKLISIPPGVLHGFTPVGNEMSIMANCSSELYNYKKPDEIRISVDDENRQFMDLKFTILYDWKIKNK